jgi:lipoprotein-anchoring transpeptidase ErfK/SrfK
MLFRLALLLIGVIGAAAAVGAAAPAAGQNPTPIARGVTVYGIDVGGLTSEPARERLRTAFEHPVTFVLDDKTWQVGPGAFGGRAAVDAAVTQALASSRPGEVELELGFERKRIVDYVKRLDRRYSKAAVDTKLVGLSGVTPSFSEARTGRKLQSAALVRTIEHLLRTGGRNPVTLTFRPVAPKVTPATFGPVVVIRRESKRIDLFDGATRVRTLPVATGRPEFPTPLGWFSIADKQRDPWWYPPDSEWAKDEEPIPPGPGNPLGTRWMGLNAFAVGIHGTPDAASIGYSASHGCIRMRVWEAEWLFDEVEVGTPVFIVAA